MDVFSQPVAIVLLCASAYLAGSVLFAIPVCRLWKLPDPRALGSGNPGATNVYRAGGWQPALATLVLDAFKGWLPVWLGQSLGMSILVQAMKAAEMLGADFGVTSEIWSATSFNELARDCQDVARHNRLNPLAEPKVSFVAQQLAKAKGPVTVPYTQLHLPTDPPR